jgi:hypothetical protein
VQFAHHTSLAESSAASCAKQDSDQSLDASRYRVVLRDDSELCCFGQRRASLEHQIRHSRRSAAHCGRFATCRDRDCGGPLRFLAEAPMMMMLDHFLAANREEIVRRCRAQVAARSLPLPVPTESDHGIPLFLDQLMTVSGSAWPSAAGVSKPTTVGSLRGISRHAGVFSRSTYRGCSCRRRPSRSGQLRVGVDDTVHVQCLRCARIFRKRSATSPNDE